MLPRAVTRPVRRLSHRLRGEHHDWLVLLYHRVAQIAVDPWGLAVTPGHFEEHLQVLRRSYRVLPLADLHAEIERGDRPRRTVAVTFDDGYADNFDTAYPLLAGHDIPATMFVTTGPLTYHRGLWWDELERALLSSGPVPGVLDVVIGSERLSWSFEDAHQVIEPESARRRPWRAWEAPPSARHACYYAIWKRLKDASDAERWTVIDQLLAWAGLPCRAEAGGRTLTADDIASLAEGGLVEIGAHAVTHASLASLAPAAQRDEVRRSKSDLEGVLGRPVVSFAYPFGQRIDYSDATQAEVQAAGFERACSATGARPRRQVDRFAIPRLHVDDLDGDAFAGWLKDWLDD